jgi:hypothetical protein
MIRAARSMSDLRAIHGMSHVSSCVVRMLSVRVVVRVNHCLRALVRSFRYTVRAK